MAARIRILPEVLINQIAAGEVVEGPASVVKELVENAVDAGASHVRIEILGGGRSLVRIVDDGCGMSRDDALLALERHATSKIATTEDLFDIRTMGFRGEALAAISGVSKLELVTRMADMPMACRVFAQGGVVRQVEGVDAPVGTSLAIRDLFFNTPARQKFLKSTNVETAQVIDVLSRLALAHDQVGFTLLRGPETLLQVEAGVTGAARIAAILGPELASHLHPFRSERAGMQVWGFLSDPEVSRSGWSSLYAFVNARSLKDRLLNKAVGEAYRGSIPKGKYPAVVLFLQLDPTEVDVNVHPGKLEVRFARPKAVSELIQGALLGTLNRAPWRRAAAGLGVPFSRSSLEDPPHRLPPQGMPPQLELDGFSGPGDDATLETPLRALGYASRIPLEGDGHFSASTGLADTPGGIEPSPDLVLSEEPPFSEEDERARIASLSELDPPAWAVRRSRFDLTRSSRQPPSFGLERASSPTPSSSQDAPSAGVTLEEHLATEAGGPSIRPGSVPVGSAPAGSVPAGVVPAGVVPAGPAEGASDPVDPVAGSSLAPAPQRTPPAALPTSPLAANSAPSPRPMPERSELLPGFEGRNFSRMRVIGQYANCFILCQDGDELVILDQHAAHERVTFEQLRAAYDGMQGRSQLLLTPRIVDLPRRESELLLDYQEAFSRLGLDIEPFGGPTWAVKALPIALADEDPASLLSHIASDLTGDTLKAPLADRIYLMLATMACHGSIRANRPMRVAEMEALLKLLDGTPFAYACPHGRPLVARSTRREVERLFKRT